MYVHVGLDVRTLITVTTITIHSSRNAINLIQMSTIVIGK